MRAALIVMLMVIVAGCGGATGKTAQSPVAAVSPATTRPAATATTSPSLSPSPSAPEAAAPSPSPSPLATPAGTLLVIDDYNTSQVRLARLDALDTAAVSGHYDGVANGQVIVIDGTALKALGRSGAVRTLDTLAAGVIWTGPGTVAVKPDVTQWVYTTPDANWTSRIHLGTIGGSDRVIATIPSPDGTFYQAFAWNASGVYFVRQATGLGGVGPFLEYHFPLARFDLASGRMTDVSPVCYAFAVLDEGTLVCRGTYNDPDLQVRTQSGLTISLRMTLPTNTEIAHVLVSPNNSRLIASRNGSTDQKVNYQMAAAGLTDTTASAFGPLDYVPDTWLPDGRVVADHYCWPAEMGGGSCNNALDGTYIFSANGSTRSFFFKLKTGAIVNYI